MKNFSLLLILLSFLSCNSTNIEKSVKDNSINESRNNQIYIVEKHNDENAYSYDLWGPDTLFVTNIDNFIVIPEKDLCKTHQISHDFDKDGIEETIYIGPSQSYYEVIGIYGDQKYKLDQYLREAHKPCWGEDFDLDKKCSFQITHHDLDSDNNDELIITFGGIDAMCYSVVFKVQNSKTEAFSYIGDISAGAYMKLLEDNTIWCPIGFQGLGDFYVLKNGKLIINDTEVE